MMLSGLAFPALNLRQSSGSENTELFKEDLKNLPLWEFDVVVAGGGTAGVVAAIAAARQGAKTAIIEA